MVMVTIDYSNGYIEVNGSGIKLIIERWRKMDLQEAYRAMQKASGIEVGDKVKVIRRFRACELGSGSGEWNWSIGKEGMQGQFGVVTGIDTVMGFIKVGHWEFPFFALEIVEKAKPAKILTVGGLESAITKAMKAYVNGCFSSNDKDGGGAGV